MSTPIAVSNATFDHEVLQSDVPVLVDFHANWCGPCQLIAPAVDEIASEANGAFRVVKLDIDDNGDTAAQYDVATIPTLLLFKNGEPVERVVGAVSKQAILDRIHEHVSAGEAIDRWTSTHTG